MATFFAFGTQKVATFLGELPCWDIDALEQNILKAWKFWGKEEAENPDELQPQGYPMLNWSDVPERQPMQFDGGAFEREEKGKPTPGYLKALLRLGGK